MTIPPIAPAAPTAPTALPLHDAPLDSLHALSFAERSCLPEWAARALDARDIAERYTPSAWLNPFTLRGHFDSDTLADCAVTAVENRSGKRGILIVHRADLSVHVAGAGTESGAGGDDFEWMDAWQVSERALVENGAVVQRDAAVERGSARDAPPALANDVLWVAKTESASGLIFWDGQRYLWSQQAD
ncbi:MAG: hypothetical protein ACKVU1_02305 [bacterium]